MERRLVEKGGMIRMCAGLHLEIDPRGGGGKMSIYEKKRGGGALCTCAYMCIGTYTLGESGGMLP